MFHLPIAEEHIFFVVIAIVIDARSGEADTTEIPGHVISAWTLTIVVDSPSDFAYGGGVVSHSASNSL